MTDPKDSTKSPVLPPTVRTQLLSVASRARALALRVRELLGQPASAPESSHAAPATTEKTAQETNKPTLLRADEPLELAPEFQTTTMGNLLLAQGRLVDAERVFRTVLQRTPKDRAAQRGLEEVEARQKTGALPDEPHEMLDRAPPPVGYEVTEARALPVDPTTLVVFWEWTDAAEKRARSLAGTEAEACIQVVSVWDDNGDPRRSEQLVRNVPARGDYFVRGLPAGATHQVSVGLRGTGEFVPLALAGPIATPLGEPRERIAQVKGTLFAVPSPVFMDPPKASAPPPVERIEGPVEALQALVEENPGTALTQVPQDTQSNEHPAEHEPLELGALGIPTEEIDDGFHTEWFGLSSGALVTRNRLRRRQRIRRAVSSPGV